jgi:hypothetical protein
MKTPVKPLFPGDEVRALKVLDPVAANVQPGDLGVVFESESDGPGGEFVTRFGPLVRWHSGGVCNVYEGDVELVDRGGNGLRPTLRELVKVFIGEDPDLGSSTCSCCEGKRAALARLKQFDLLG